MMSKQNNALAVILAIAMLIGLGFGAYYIAIEIYQYFQDISEERDMILMVVLISTVIIGISISRAGRVHGVQRLRLEKKTQCYERFVKVWCDMATLEPGDTASITAATEALATAIALLKLWASNQVIKQIVILQASSANSIANGNSRNVTIEPVIRAMRTDLGLSNLQLNTGDLEWDIFTPRTKDREQ